MYGGQGYTVICLLLCVCVCCHFISATTRSCISLEYLHITDLYLCVCEEGNEGYSSNNYYTNTDTVQWNLRVWDTLGPAILSLVEWLSSFRRLKMYCIHVYAFGDIGSVLCIEVVPFSEGPLLEVHCSRH